MQVHTARTAFLVPFTVPDGHEWRVADARWASRRGTERPKFMHVDGLPRPGREKEQSLPDEVRELDEAFQVLLRAREATGVDPDRRPWQWAHLRARPELLAETYLGRPAFNLGGGRWFESATMRRIDLIFFPLGTGVAAYHVDWHERDADTVLDAISHGRYLGHDPDRAGWRFRTGVDATPESAAHRGSFGGALLSACYGGESVSLGELTHWLLEAPGGARAARVTSSRYATHHSCILLDEPAAPEEARRLLFHLRRAFPAHYEAPREAPRGDAVLEPRGNRAIGISREGTAALTWHGRNGLSEYDTTIWPHKFLGIYLLLGLHALGERQSLTRLSSEIASFSNSLTDMRILRREHRDGRLGRLHRRVVRHTTTLTADDCGGPTDWSNFFRAMREVHNVREHLDEVRAEATELFQLSEATGQNYVQTMLAIVGAALAPLFFVLSVGAMPDSGLFSEPWRVWTALGVAAVIGIGIFLRLKPKTWH